jgi:hypothetical protein
MLLCELSASEILDRTTELVSKTKEREVRQDSLREWKAEKAQDQKEREAEIVHLGLACFKLAEIIESGEEERSVYVSDVLEGSQVFSRRDDTGQVLDQRAATAEELQLHLPDVEEVAPEEAP